MELDKFKLHFAYIVSFLIIVIVVISTGLWTDKENFTEYLTNASTAISIVLGLVAIFYSFISNSSLSQSLGNISKVSEEVVQTKNQIEMFLKHADDLENKGAENTNSLKEISNSVESHVVSLREALGSITEKTESLQNAVSGRFDKFEYILAETSNALASKPNDEKPAAIVSPAHQQKFVNTFLGYSSLIGLTVAYACVLASRGNKKLALEEIGRIFSFDNSYIHGYYVAMVSARLFNHEEVGGETLTYMITDVDETLGKEAKAALVNKLENLYKKNSIDTFNKHQKDIAIMENYLGE